MQTPGADPDQIQEQIWLGAVNSVLFINFLAHMAQGELL